MPFEPAAEAAGHCRLPWHATWREKMTGCFRSGLENAPNAEGPRMNRRRFLQTVTAAAGAVAVGPGTWLLGGPA
ncbi:MAG: twin-arginine translocation signal domain-containing protein, partial [Planctomycetes bacterium]|nr:twin-arginine translocation signal domain-containing protein [Planctomycetota bacterium]